MNRFYSNPNFQPTEILSFIGNLDSGAGTLIVETDAGRGYLKALGNPDGPHALVKDFIGTHLASQIGLPTFDYAIVDVDEIDELPFFRGGMAAPGPAFVTRSERGATWGKDPKLLQKAGNLEAFSGLVVIDTWLRNTDRCWKPANRVNLDNVFFSTESDDAPVALRAMDFSHCIAYGGELTKRVKNIDDVRDEDIYGLFTEFRPLLKRDSVRYYTNKLSGLSRSEFQAAVDLVPNEWEIDSQTRMALIDFLTQRAGFVADNFEDWLFGPEQPEFASLGGGDE